MKYDTGTSSVEKAFGLLDFLAASGKPASLQEVTEALKLSKPTAYRLLRALQELGYVTRPADRRDYLVGPRTALLAAVDPYAELKSQARPLLRHLHEEFNETVNLGVLSGTQVFYLDFLETTRALRFILTPGRSDPYYCTALGCAAAAQLGKKQFSHLLSDTRFRSLTQHTIKSQEELQCRILKTKKTGIAEEMQESVEGVCCLAVSLEKQGFPTAAISIAVPIQRLEPKRKIQLSQALQKLINT